MSLSRSENASLKKVLSDLLNRLSVLNGEHYGSSNSQKGIGKKKTVKGRNSDKDDFDGTPGFLSCSPSESTPASSEAAESCPSGATTNNQIYHDPSRLGCKYDKAVVGTPVIHKCDVSKLPLGTEILSVDFYKVRDVVSRYQIYTPAYRETKNWLADMNLEDLPSESCQLGR